jgi:D-inositol-3-phosphate glycosyltransferase
MIPPNLKRIALLSLHTSPLATLGGKKTGGMNVYVREIARVIGEYGIAVDIFTRESSPGTHGQIQVIGKNARLIFLPAGPPETLDPSAIYRYIPEFRDALLDFADVNKYRYDVIFSHYWLSGWVALELKELWNIPVVQMFHTLGRMKDRIADMDRVMDTPMIGLHERNIRVSVETEIMNRADRLIAATPAESRQMLWLYRANRRKIDIVPPGVDLEHFRPLDMTLAKEKIGLSPDQRMLVFVGRIEPLKAVDTICEALALLNGDDSTLLKNICIQIVGGDPEDRTTSNKEMNRLRALCDRLGLNDVVLFIGAKDQTILPYYYNAAEALIMPSDYESFGMVALEAMACGTPVIASQVGGLAFLVKDDVTGFHVPIREPQVLAERIYALLGNIENRQRMGRMARKVAEAYSWDHIAQQLLQVFGDILPKSSQFTCEAGSSNC